MKLHAFGEKEAYDHLGRESCLVILNHRGELDWLAGFTIAARYNFMHVSTSSRADSILIRISKTTGVTRISDSRKRVWS